ncbi:MULTISPECIES: M3 family metallopeptidase [unclassified Nocardioides]|uniref:M3 family metallopeptidase n=1 Tax=unclassified Nocardioides TaxID=2615069 RepID=UPI0006FD933F|nr:MULTISPECIES: M3 family metallopeptidase [unclassified Nocardioides]KRA39037.1 peptidase M3 [Nocardioides sp. Root614]KRA92996.1 peptidase M3 [Nocardioides sp. Root682]
MTTEPLALPTSPDAWPAWIRDRGASELALATELVEGLRNDPPADPVAVLRQWDRAGGHLGNVAAVGSLFGNVHPSEEVRELADNAEQEASRVGTRWSLDRDLYDVFAGIEDSAVADDPLATRLLAKVRADFRRSGVDKDEATRDRISAIRERITELDQEFSRVIRDDVRTIQVTPDRLDGMPADWLEAHPVDDEGLVTVTTDYPDSVPVRMFAHDQDVRRDITIAFQERGWPATEALLVELFSLRHELATTVGYADWPSYDADVKMIRTGPAIPEFIDKIAAAAEEPMQRDLGQLLERYRRDFPDATVVPGYDYNYYAELVRAEKYDVDSQRVRTYFDFGKVRQGLLDVTGRLFGLRYEQVDVPVWHEEVTAYDVFAGVSRLADARTSTTGESRVGRIYLDLHPRDGKYKHAAQFTLVDGVEASDGHGQTPEGVLVCNFARGLMEHDHVVTLFHEFGHLLHHVLAGHGDWFRFAGVATEWDFVEAPSQMLEEWAWHADVLQTFATDAAGEPIPADLVTAMRDADDYGKGIFARTQMFYAAMSYWFHADRARAEVPDLTDRMVELQGKYAALPYLPDTHMFASFGHLGGYSSGYYTYMWSLVIAKDLFSAFDDTDVFAAEAATRYRDRILVPGGAGDAADLVADFLGRPFSFEAYAAWLAR